MLIDRMAPSTLAESGFLIVPTGLERERLESLRESVFHPGIAGTRCLLGEPDVAAAARAIGAELRRAGFLAAGAAAIQAIAFDKSPEANWKVTWHQDLVFPFARRVSDPAYATPSLKDGLPRRAPNHRILASGGEFTAVRFNRNDIAQMRRERYQFGP